jgi:MFS family permease
MAISSATGLSDAQHRVQLRRAVVAGTVGTIIEAYDFLLYVQVAPLVFAKLYFPSSDPLVGTLQAFGIYAVGFVSRPVGAALFGHYGDRIGRKVTLIATLLGGATLIAMDGPGLMPIAALSPHGRNGAVRPGCSSPM